ncbi:MAG: 30S ribosomal protein S20 [Bdellovibrionota bacterium]|nr:30S ribosomal protein S20 [Pseudomonadota bacterium]MDY6090134.1 30S ribosomal protein S20 [Bdellovibrionota bacterium]
MPNHKSAEKRLRQNLKKRIRNRLVKSACRTAVKKVNKAIEENDIERAREYFLIAEKKLASAATKGIYHKKNASRRISRLALKLNNIQAK